MAQTKRRVSEPTHPTVWAGLGLAIAGLLVSVYAYTGARVYDIAFFFVAIGGGVLALAGILAAAWGRALGSSRRKRAEKAVRFGAPATAEAGPERPAEKPAPPTVAAPAEKRSILARLVPKGAPKEPAAPAKPVFAFKRRGAPVAEAGNGSAAVAVQASPVPVLERLTIACPECGETFSAEGIRPFNASCPKCSFSAEV